MSASVIWNTILTLSLGLTGVMWLISDGNHLPNRATWRSGLGVILLLLGGQAVYDSLVFVKLISTAQIVSSLPVPLSAVVCIVLVCNLNLVLPSRRVDDASMASDIERSVETHGSEWRVTRLRLGDVISLLAGMSFGQMLMILMHVLTFGSTDYRREADVAVVLGARVYADGTLSLALFDRLQTAVDLYEAKQVRTLLVSGATGIEGVNEAHAMRQFLIEAGIPDDRILVDDAGANTLLTARNVRRILDEQRLTSVLIVSHYFHLARCKLLFEEHGINSVTVPARMSRRLVFESYFVMRECAGYLWYALTRPLRSVLLKAN
ncbi:MAG: YdcF family protein [Planctomycetia bacterium]|nr:YdcF family protein [Planctomycetia bacterium]